MSLPFNGYMSLKPTRQSKEWRCHLLKGVLSLALLAGASGVSEVQAESLIIDYSREPDENRLLAFERSILQPSCETDLSRLKKAGHRAIAYVSVVEIAANADYREEVQKQGIKFLGKNEIWNSDLVDIADPNWKKFVIETLAKSAADKGYEGLFLDTVDSVTLLERAGMAPESAREAMTSIIAGLREAYPKMPIIMNRGFSLLEHVEGLIDSVLIESVFQTYDFKTGKYDKTTDQNTARLKEWVQYLQDRKKEVIIVDYVNPNESERAQVTAKLIKDLGCVPFITTPDLLGASLAPIQESKRKILVLYGWDETERRPLWPIDTFTSERLQMPLEWLGYECEYWHSSNDPIPGDISGRYAGIICDAELDVPFARQVSYAKWLVQQSKRGVKILIVGQLPVQQDDACETLAKGLKLQGSCEAVEQPDEVRISLLDKDMMNFEADVRPHIAEFWDLRAPVGASVFLSLTSKRDGRTAGYFDPIFTTDWGGALLEPYTSFTASANVSLSLFDPFRFLAKFFPEDDFPAPDTTTRDGMRMLFSHIDGDGFASLSTMKRNTTCAEIVRDRVLKHYKIPVTVSIIEANTRAVEEGMDPGLKGEYEDLARSIFELPNVQAASHTFTHPYIWIEGDPDYQNLYETSNIVLQEEELKAYPKFDYHREIEGSIRYMEETLLPKDKKVELLLWSGNCRPPDEAIAIVRELGIENMNGGDTIASSRNPGLSAIAPRTITWPGGELQVYAPNQNEYVYTKDWRGPFYGGFQHVIETFELTEVPRRLKPVNIYYHFYSVSRMGAFRALEKIHNWAIEQPLHSVTAATYAKIARDSWKTRIFKKSPKHWRIINSGYQRTFRFPVSAGYPDLSLSKGITGYVKEKDWHYIHTGGDEICDLVVSEKDKPSLRLEKSSAEISFQALTKTSAIFTTEDLRAIRVVFGGVTPGSSWLTTINESATSESVTADSEGRLVLSLPLKAAVKLQQK